VFFGEFKEKEVLLLKKRKQKQISESRNAQVFLKSAQKMLP
jgi:hypothetical protein